jgi:hypothetical protein
MRNIPNCTLCNISYIVKDENDFTFRVFWMSIDALVAWTDRSQPPPSYVAAASTPVSTTCAIKSNVYVDVGVEPVSGYIICDAFSDCNFRWTATVSALTSLPPSPAMPTPALTPSSDNARVRVF